MNIKSLLKLGLGIGIAGGLLVATVVVNERELQTVEEAANNIDNTNDNLVSIYDNGYKLYKKVREDSIKSSKSADSRSVSLLETDFSYCKFNMLNMWTEEADDKDLYYKNEPETLEKEPETLEKESETLGGESEGLGEGPLDGGSQLETELVEQKDIKPRTFIIIDVSGFYNNDTVNGMYFEFYSGDNLIGSSQEQSGIKSTMINKMENEVTFLFELPGTYHTGDVQYKPVASNDTNIVEGNIQNTVVTDIKQYKGYSLLDKNGSTIAIIKKESTEGSNRIDLVDETETAEETAESNLIAEESRLETKETIQKAKEISHVVKEKGPGITESSLEAEESTAISESAEEKPVRTYQKEVYNLAYSFEAWGKSEELKRFNGSTVQVVRKGTNEAVDITDNLQVKYNDSKYRNADPDDVFIELSFSVNTQIPKDKINTYLESQSMRLIPNQTINTVKNRINSLFSFKIGDNIIDNLN